MVVPDTPFPVADVDRRPVVVREGLPHLVLAVERDRIVDLHVLSGPADVVDVPLEPELGRVRPDHDEPVVAVGLRPRADVAERAQPVDARERPEVDEHDLAAQAVSGERFRVEPAGGAGERREHALGDGAHRSVLKASRTSLAKSSGSSHAAKCPPRAALLKYTTFG